MTTLCRLSICACFVFSFSCFAQTNPPPPRKKPLPAVRMASWNEKAEKSFGVSHEDFKSMGFSKLTQDEYGLLLFWISAQKTHAEQKGMEEAQAAALTYSCGLNVAEEAAASKVNVIIEDDKNTPAALVSGIRQRVRSIPDVQIVYDTKDADLRISVMAFENQLKGSNEITGYTAAIITTTPCISKFGTTESNFQKYHSATLQSGGRDLNTVVERIVTTLDSDDIEPIRQEHAEIKKLVQEKKN